MDRLPTLLILAPPLGGIENADFTHVTPARNQAMEKFAWMENVILTGLNCALPLLLVSANHISERARQILPGNSVLDIQITKSEHHTDLDLIAQLISAGVSASPNANGWLAVPINILPKIDTIHKIADALRHYSLASTQYKQVSGFPIAFSSEFYSELVHLQNAKDLTRLISRYPNQEIYVNDPGILFNQPGNTTLHGAQATDTRHSSTLHVVYPPS